MSKKHAEFAAYLTKRRKELGISMYTVAKDFWSRVPWNMTDRYYICYSDGRVDTFGQST